MQGKTVTVPHLTRAEIRLLTPEQRKERFSIQRNDWQKRNPEKARAKVYAQRYTQIKNKCDLCTSTEGLGRHHIDYSQPLLVLTLCKKCHKIADRIRRKTDNHKSVLLDRHCFNCNKTCPSCGRAHPSFKGRACSLWEESKEAK